MHTNSSARPRRLALRNPGWTWPLRSLSIALLAAALGASFTPCELSRSFTTQAGAALSTERLACVYDPNGAADELINHKLNLLNLRKRRSQANLIAQITTAGLTIEDDHDLSLIEDDGSIVISPAKFDLKNRSIIFTPEGDGYRISNGDVPFNRDFGGRLGFFFGVDGRLEDGDNGYRDLPLAGAPFPFFGVSYDTIFIGTNGYITFTGGDTTARISPTSFAGTLPRIAPLWADLEVVTSGDIHYNRFAGYHLITWSGAGQPAYGGINTFQTLLYDDGRIAFVYKKAKAQAALAGISPGAAAAEPIPIDLSEPPAEKVTGPVFEVFGKQERLDLPAALKAFYLRHSDSFDTAYVWTDFDYDNGLGLAHSFNVRNDIRGIGLKSFDRGAAYGSPAGLSTIITMGNAADWPSDPQAHAAGLNSAISIVCHEQGHRWLAYVRFDADHDIKDNLLGRENAHWSFLVDTRTNAQGSFSSLMEGNAWRDTGAGTFTTVETAVNYFTPLDQYLMGLRPADEVGEIPYLVTDPQVMEFLRDKSPLSGFSMSASRKITSVAQIIEREGPRIPDSASAPKVLRVAFILLTRQGSTASSATLEKISRYREALVRYYGLATGSRGTMDTSLKD
jgi:hypothetical protein